MSRASLILSIVRGVYLIDPRYANGLLPSVKNLIEGKPVSYFDDDDDSETTGKKKVDKHAVFAVRPQGNSIQSFESYDDAPAGSVAVISYRGVIMKQDNCGTPGSATIKKRVQEARQHPNVGACVVIMDSGGGSVDGTFELADEIGNFGKPLISWVDGMACSAGYGIVSKSKEIYASHAAAEVGSIGTAVTFWDDSEALAKWGYKMIYINADASTDKNQDYFEALKNNYKPIRDNILNPTNEIFLETVRNGRAGKLDTKKENSLTGKVYLADRATEIGLIDGVKTYEQVIDRAFQLAQSHSNSNNNSMTVLEKIQKGLTGKTTGETYTPTAEELSSMGLVAHSKSDYDTLKAAKDKADTDLVAANEKVTKAEGERDALQAKLDRKPGEEITTTTSNTGTETDAEMWDKMKNLEHNRIADARG
jgi:ClpP class serine protease